MASRRKNNTAIGLRGAIALFGAAAAAPAIHAAVPTYEVELVSVYTTTTSLQDASNAGHLVGWQVDGGLVKPFIATPADGLTHLPLPTGYNSGAAMGVNDAGVIVGAVDDAGLPIDLGEPAIWIPDGTGGYTVTIPQQFETVQSPLGPLSVNGGMCIDINNNGTVIGWSRYQGFQGGPTTEFSLNGAPIDVRQLGFDATVRDINDNGVICGDETIFDLNTNNATNIGVPDPIQPGNVSFTNAIAFAINNNNETVVAANLASVPTENWLTYKHTPAEGYSRINPDELPARFVGFYDNNDLGDVASTGGILFADENTLETNLNNLIDPAFSTWDVSVGFIDNNRRIATTAVDASTGQNALVLLNPAEPQIATVTVTQLDDAVDVASSATIADLPGPDGLVSFREALIAVNNTAGAHRIAFAVPTDPDSPLDSLLRIDGPAFVLTRDNTTIDFNNQADPIRADNPTTPGFGILNINPSFIGQPAFVINASDCEVRALGSTQFRDSIVVAGGHDNTIAGNFCQSITLDPDFGSTTTGNTIGGTSPADRNETDRISLLCGANDNVVVGNKARAIDVTGSPFCGTGTTTPTGNRIGGPTPAERNIVSGFGTYSGQGRPSGIGILIDNASQTTIEGNYIGVNEDGTAQAPDQNRGTTGIEARDSTDTTIQGNLVSGIRGIGIADFAGQVFGRAILINALNDDVSSIVIEGNLIGTDLTGEQPIPTRAGIEIIPGTVSRTISSVRIGGNAPDAANTIAFTDLAAITVAGPNISGVEISQNRMFSNGGLAIDLQPSPSGPAGVTPNDPLDADEGPNNFQNFPVISGAELDGDTATVNGQLLSEPARTYRVEVFVSPMADPSGNGEGRLLLGSITLTTDNSGAATFNHSFTAPPNHITDGWIATATATDTDRGETSEFGPSIAIDVNEPCPSDLDNSGQTDLPDLLLVLGNFGNNNPAADADGSGQVDLADLLLVLGDFGQVCP